MEKKLTFEEQVRLFCTRRIPLVVVDGAVDELATTTHLIKELAVHRELVYVWNPVDGLLTDAGSREFTVAEQIRSTAAKSRPTMQPDAALTVIGDMLADPSLSATGYESAFIFMMGDRLLDYDVNREALKISQRLMLLRDQLALGSASIYFVGIDHRLPAELREHVVMLQAKMPDEEELGELIDKVYEKYTESYDVSKSESKPEKFLLDEDTRPRLIESLKGMSKFNAQQTLYLSMDLSGIHLARVRQRAIDTINKTKGLSVYTGNGSGFEALGGLEQIKGFAKRMIAGRLRVKTVVYIDEIEKALAGSRGTDTSGVSQNLLGTILSEMQDTNSVGMLLTGVYGAGKSEFAKRFGEEAGAITARLDISGLKDSLVGSSEANLRQAMRVIRSIGGEDGGIFWIATCNRISHLPPELKRRFNLGTFFFGFPTPEERAEIWKIYLDAYDLPPDEAHTSIDDTDWTGAEIESCCRLAHLMNSPLDEASRLIVPVSQTAKEEIAELMNEADGRYLSVSEQGLFSKPAPRARYQKPKRLNL